MHNQSIEFLSVLKKKAVRAKIEEFRPELPEFTLGLYTGMYPR